MADEEQEYYGYYYGEEDKGLLDPAWERQQRKVRDFDSILYKKLRVVFSLGGCNYRYKAIFLRYFLVI